MLEPNKVGAGTSGHPVVCLFGSGTQMISYWLVHDQLVCALVHDSITPAGRAIGSPSFPPAPAFIQSVMRSPSPVAARREFYNVHLLEQYDICFAFTLSPVNNRMWQLA